MPAKPRPTNANVTPGSIVREFIDLYETGYDRRTLTDVMGARLKERDGQALAAAPAFPVIVYGIERRHFARFEYILFAGLEDETGIHSARFYPRDADKSQSPYYLSKREAEKAMRSIAPKGTTPVHCERKQTGPLTRY